MARPRPSQQREQDRARARSWLIWFVGALIYLLAVFHRTSFGVAGLYAAERFAVGAAALAAFTVLQVGVYAAMQIPTGVLVDRFGPRRVLTAALLLLGFGQVLLALAQSYPVGLFARGVLGLGDALTFVSVLRLIATHFSGRQYPLIASLTTAMGYVGNLAATFPLAMAVAGQGWTPTFLVVGLGTSAFAAVAVLCLRDAPHGAAARATRPTAERPAAEHAGGSLAQQVAGAWREPGTRLGFWVHFSTMFAPNVLTLLWGVPFLVRGQGFEPAAASALLMVFVFGSMIGGPAVGGLIARRASLRMPLTVAYLLVALLVWAVLLSWPGSIPLAVLIPCFALLSLGGPVSTVGFMLARDYNPTHRVGTSTGVVNVGGFVATTIAALLVGVLVQVSAGQYRVALLAVVAVLIVGAYRVLVWWRRARGAVFAAIACGDEVPVHIRRRAWDLPAAESECSAR
ncbi:MFS transporter [Bounagaea algeriensis]